MLSSTSLRRSGPTGHHVAAAERRALVILSAEEPIPWVLTFVTYASPTLCCSEISRIPPVIHLGAKFWPLLEKVFFENRQFFVRVQEWHAPSYSICTARSKVLRINSSWWRKWGRMGHLRGGRAETRIKRRPKEIPSTS